MTKANSVDGRRSYAVSLIELLRLDCGQSSDRYDSLAQAEWANTFTEAAWRSFYDQSKKDMLSSENPYCRQLAMKFKVEDDAKAASDAIDRVMQSLK